MENNEIDQNVNKEDITDVNEVVNNENNDEITDANEVVNNENNEDNDVVQEQNDNNIEVEITDQDIDVNKNAIDTENDSEPIIGPIPTVNSSFEPVIDPSNVVDPMQVVTPSDSVVNTEKVKEPSSKILFVFALIIGVFVFFVDDVVNLFTEDNYMYYNSGSNKNNVSSNNLVNGYIEIGVQNSFMKLEDVRFYNFKKSNERVISFDYTSDSNIKDSKELEIYILIYNGSGVLLYKELFDESERINKNSIKQYSMNVDNDVYMDAHFAKVVIFTESEKKAQSSIICEYKKTEGDVNVNYKVTYNFVNNDLKNYDVVKQIDSKDNESDIYNKYNNELLTEKEEASKYKINISEDINYLSYKVDLTNAENKEYKLYYGLNTLPYTIEYKESLKGWTCK